MGDDEGDRDAKPEEVTGELVPADASRPDSRRTQGGMFAPGVSGCPGGKPPGWGEFRRKLAALDDTAIQALADGLKAKSLRTRAVYLRVFFDYRIGRKVSLSDEDGNVAKLGSGSVILIAMPPESGTSDGNEGTEEGDDE